MSKQQFITERFGVEQSSAYPCSAEKLRREQFSLEEFIEEEFSRKHFSKSELHEMDKASMKGLDSKKLLEGDRNQPVKQLTDKQLKEIKYIRDCKTAGVNPEDSD